MRKRHIVIGVAAGVLFACGGGYVVTQPQPSPTPTPSTTGTPAVAGCLLPGNPAAHVYHPDRLHVLNPCAKVSGTIAAIRVEADGDFHIQLRVDSSSLDPNGGHWINAKNTSAQNGNLVLEPVCENPVTQSDAVAACQGYHDPIVVPAVGSHVIVTGAWVLDAQHGWQEIHPIASMVVK